jgi:hypothetical protein
LGTLAFFPWAALRDPVTIRRYELLPYRRGQLPAGTGHPDQRTIDTLLDPYRSAPKGPVRDATLLRRADTPLLADINDDDADELLRFGELVAFAGLSARRYFDRLGYANRDNFQLVVQRFQDPGSGMTVLSRRRDGSSWIAVTKSAMLIVKPHHVSTPAPHRIDVPLLEALVDRSSREEWGEIEEAIQGFNSANTDSPDVRMESEVVSLVGAFERALGLRGGDEHELANAFVECLKPVTAVRPADCNRVSASPRRERDQGYATLGEVWIRDFFRLRGDHAHGKIAPKYRSLWSLREHLLCGSFAFPLLIKARLVREGFYTWSEEDLVYLEALEALLCAKHFEIHDESKEGPFRQDEWSRILDDANTQIRVQRWVETKDAEHNG